MTAECPYTLQCEEPFPRQNCPFPQGDLDPSNTWLFGPTRVLNLNGISIHSAIFAGLTSVTEDRSTHHATQSVTTGRIDVRTIAMRFKK